MITATMANNKNNLLTFFTPFCESLRNEKIEKRASYYNIILLTNKMKKNIIKVLRIKTKKKHEKSTVLNNILNTMDFYDISSNGLYLFLSSICFLSFLNDVKFTFLVVYPPYSLLESFQFKLSSALDCTSFFKF